MLVDRLMRYKLIEPDNVVIRAVLEAPLDESLYRMVLHEIVNVAECSEHAAAPLLRWLVAVAGFKPFLFNGFEAKAVGTEAVHLVRAPTVEDNLYKRWGLQPQRVRHG